MDAQKDKLTKEINTWNELILCVKIIFLMVFCDNLYDYYNMKNYAKDLWYAL